jgi:hypothetical protein
MDKDKLSPQEEALLAEARREAGLHKGAPSAPAAAPPEPQAETRPVPTSAERLAKLMDEERAETQERKKKMRRYGITISGSILALFVLWVLTAFRRRR